MFTHSVFGFRLQCDFALPELPPAREESGDVWRVEKRNGEPPPAAATEQIGSEAVHGAVCVAAFRSEDAFRLAFDDTGTFDIRATDRMIAWYPGPDAGDAAVRADLLGRVMALVAHADGRLALHASAVSIDGRAVAFLGPKHAGKSTLALALVRRGARLVADDTLVVRVEAACEPRVTVGVQRPRLWNDALDALALRGSSGGDKPIVDPLPSDCLEHAEVPLSACYVLAPIPDDGTAIIRSAPLTSVHATVACVRFAKAGALLGGREAPVVLARAAGLVSSVAMYSIGVVRNLERLDAVAAQLFDWHATHRLPNVASPA